MKDYLYEIEKIKDIISEAEYVVFFGGAGVSTESGIPDFRGNGGIYTGSGESNEYYLSKRCLKNEPEKFFEFLKKNMVFPDAEPNGAHKALAGLEEDGVLKAVITQNIDGLHQKAGSKRVIELHGSAQRYYCTKCGKLYDWAFVEKQDGMPRCTACAGNVRPDVTLYGEALDGYNFADAEEEISKADVLIVGGTSLVVQPAASLVDAFSGEHLIIINYSSTPYDGMAEYTLRASLSEVLSEIVDRMEI